MLLNEKNNENLVPEAFGSSKREHTNEDRSLQISLRLYDESNMLASYCVELQARRKKKDAHPSACFTNGNGSLLFRENSPTMEFQQTTKSSTEKPFTPRKKFKKQALKAAASQPAARGILLPMRLNLTGSSKIRFKCISKQWKNLDFLAKIIVALSWHWLSAEAKGLVGKLPGNPASCPDEPCNSDPQHVLHALKWTSLGFGIILLLPVLMYYFSKLISKLHSLCSTDGKQKKQQQQQDGFNQGSSPDAQQYHLSASKKFSTSTSAECSVESPESSSQQQDISKRPSVERHQSRRATQIGLQLEQTRKSSSGAELASFDVAQLNEQLQAQNHNLEERNRQFAEMIANSSAIIQQQQQQLTSNPLTSHLTAADNQQLIAANRHLQHHRFSVMLPQQQQYLGHEQKQQQQQSSPKRRRHNHSSSKSPRGNRAMSRRLIQVFPANDNDNVELELDTVLSRSGAPSPNGNSGKSASVAPQISIVGQLYQQQNRLALPPNGAAQHRHSIDGSIINNMVQTIQQHQQPDHEQVNNGTRDVAQLHQQHNAGLRSPGAQLQVKQEQFCGDDDQALSRKGSHHGSGRKKRHYQMEQQQ